MHTFSKKSQTFGQPGGSGCAPPTKKQHRVLSITHSSLIPETHNNTMKVTSGTHISVPGTRRTGLPLPARRRGVSVAAALKKDASNNKDAASLTSRVGSAIVAGFAAAVMVSPGGWCL